MSNLFGYVSNFSGIPKVSIKVIYTYRGENSL